jgi:methyltransferase
MVTEAAFFGLVSVVVLQRLFELRRSRRNEAYLRTLGAEEHAPGHFRAMQLLHTTWFASMCLEVHYLERPFIPLLGVMALFVFLTGQTLRLSAMRALGVRWSVRIITVPGATPVKTGIYNYLRHPNYLGVVLEIAALPLVHSAVYTALFYTAANAVLLWVRIRAEERALSEGSRYAAAFAATPRLFPRFFGSTSRS